MDDRGLEVHVTDEVGELPRDRARDRSGQQRHHPYVDLTPELLVAAAPFGDRARVTEQRARTLHRERVQLAQHASHRGEVERVLRQRDARKLLVHVERQTVPFAHHVERGHRERDVLRQRRQDRPLPLVTARDPRVARELHDPVAVEHERPRRPSVADPDHVVRLDARRREHDARVVGRHCVDVYLRACIASMSFGHDLVHVADDAEVGDPEDRRLAVLVHRDDVVGALHADHVLGGAGDAERDVELRLHDLAGLADLLRVGHPAGVDDRTRRARRALEQLGELRRRAGRTPRRCRCRGHRTRPRPPPRASAPRAPRRGARAPWPRRRARRRACRPRPPSAATAAARLGRRTTSAGWRPRNGAVALELGVDQRVPAEDRGADDQLVAVDAAGRCRW